MKSIWIATENTVSHYKKGSELVAKDIREDLLQYESLKSTLIPIVKRVEDVLKQSLYVRGVEVCFKIRKELISYEVQISKELHILNGLNKQQKDEVTKSFVSYYSEQHLSDFPLYLRRYYSNREKYLKTRTKLNALIAVKRQLRQILKQF